METEGSTPDIETQSPDLQDSSITDTSADNAVEDQQPSENETPDFFEVNEGESEDAPSQTAEDADDTSDEVDPELTQWAASQNLELTTETEIKLAKRLRDTQKSYHESKQKFENTDSQEDAEAKLQAIEGRLARADFFDAHPDARALEGKMYDVALEARDSGDEAGFEYYKTPKGWETLYRIVKAQEAEDTQRESYEAGRKEERTNLARKQQAASPAAGAVDPTPGSGEITDEMIGKMTPTEYDAFRRAHPEWDPFAS